MQVSDFTIGQRVELHPATDDWMRGDRYGAVVRISRAGTVYVRLDKSGRTRRCRAIDLTVI